MRLVCLEMRFARHIAIAILAVALAAYGFDCSGITTTEQAMQCCNSMPCSSQSHHGEDCCKTMPTSHAPFVQTALVHGRAAYSPVVALLPALPGSSEWSISVRIASTDFHPPPIFRSTAPKPLRI